MAYKYNKFCGLSSNIIDLMCEILLLTLQVLIFI